MEVGPSVFFSLLVIAVAFLPIFVLVDQEGRLFKPLAYSKNLAMGLAAILAVTLDPALRMLFARIEPFTFRPRFLAKLATTALVGTYHPEERHPISRTIFRVYDPACRFVLRHPKAVIAAAFGLVLVSLPMYFRLGSEFMPPLNEGTILYMPTTLPGISVAQAQELLIAQDKVLASYPEVERVFGKAGRADTSTDPAPLSMMETTVVLKPPDQWRGKERWYSSWAPGWVKAAAAPDLAGPHLLGRADRRHGREDALPRQHQRLDDADQGAHRHALDRDAHPGRHQDLRGRPRRDPEDRRAARGDRRQGPGHPQRLRRARHRRLLRRHRAEARPDRPLRADHRRGAARDHDRGRRRERHDHDRGARALLGQHPLPARAARRHRAARARAGRGPRGAGDGRAAGAARAARRHHARLRAGDDPRRERLPLRLRLRRPRRAGHRRLRRRRPRRRSPPS